MAATGINRNCSLSPHLSAIPTDPFLVLVRTLVGSLRDDRRIRGGCSTTGRGCRVSGRGRRGGPACCSSFDTSFVLNATSGGDLAAPASAALAVADRADSRRDLPRRLAPSFRDEARDRRLSPRLPSPGVVADIVPVLSCKFKTVPTFFETPTPKKSPN